MGRGAGPFPFSLLNGDEEHLTAQFLSHDPQVHEKHGQAGEEGTVPPPVKSHTWATHCFPKDLQHCLEVCPGGRRTPLAPFAGRLHTSLDCPKGLSSLPTFGSQS